MKKSLLVRVAILLLTTSTLAGCILVPVDDRRPRGEYHETDRGDDHGDHHDDHHEDRGDHR